MEISEVEEIVVNIKSFIDHYLTYKPAFDNIALSLYRMHHELNDVYYKYCNRKLPTRWQEIPLMPIEEFGEQPVTVNLNTEMPFPGVKFISENIEHYVRDTELYKDNISSAFPRFVLEENRWVPWVNFIGVYPDIPLDPLRYYIEYLSECLHGKLLNSIDSDDIFDLLVEVYGEEDKVTIPTVLTTTPDNLSQIINTIVQTKSENSEDFVLPYGSKVVELQNPYQSSDIKTSYDACNTFGLNNITRILSIPGISTQLYANIKKYKLDYCYKSSIEEYLEFYPRAWMKFRVVDPVTQADVSSGEIGNIALYDLANAWSCPFVLTDIRGRVGRNGGLVLDGKV